jgi:hypothetical protein
VLADRSNLVLALDPLPLVARVAMATSSTRVGAWGIRGEEWKALDSLGRVVGAAKVTDLERYDVTDCDELTLKRTKGEVGAGLFVRGSYEPLAIRAHELSKSLTTDLAKIVAKRDARVPKSQHGGPMKPELPLSCPNPRRRGDLGLARLRVASAGGRDAWGMMASRRVFVRNAGPLWGRRRAIARSDLAESLRVIAAPGACQGPWRASTFVQ